MKGIYDSKQKIIILDDCIVNQGERGVELDIKGEFDSVKYSYSFDFRNSRNRCITVEATVSLENTILRCVIPSLVFDYFGIAQVQLVICKKEDSTFTEKSFINLSSKITVEKSVNTAENNLIYEPALIDIVREQVLLLTKHNAVIGNMLEHNEVPGQVIIAQELGESPNLTVSQKEITRLNKEIYQGISHHLIDRTLNYSKRMIPILISGDFKKFKYAVFSLHIQTLDVCFIVGKNSANVFTESSYSHYTNRNIYFARTRFTDTLFSINSFGVNINGTPSYFHNDTVKNINNVYLIV